MDRSAEGFDVYLFVDPDLYRSEIYLGDPTRVQCTWVNESELLRLMGAMKFTPGLLLIRL